MWRNEGGREGAGWGYQSWIANNGGSAFHKSIYSGNTGGYTKENWSSPFYPGYMQWWSNHNNAGLAAVKGVKEIGTDSGVFAGTVS